MGLFGWRKKKEPVTFSSFEDFMENMPKGTTVDEETLRLMAMHQTYHKYVYDEQYVTRGSKLACTQGTRASLIDLPLDYGITVEDGTAVLTCCDTAVNYFGSCRCKTDAYGRYEMCRPAVSTTWHGQDGVNLSFAWAEESGSYQKLLLQSDFLTCFHGGYISVVEVAGQTVTAKSVIYDVGKFDIDPRALRIMEENYKADDDVRDMYESDGLCVFGIEGLGAFSGNGDPTLFPDGRYGALMVATKGRNVVFVTKNASTLPSTNADNIGMIDEGVYYIEGKKHQGKYPSFGCYRTEDHSYYVPGTRRTPGQGSRYIDIDEFYGVNIHTAPTNVGSLYSEGCNLICTGDYIPFLIATGCIDETDEMAKYLDLNYKNIESSITFRAENAYPTGSEEGKLGENKNPYDIKKYGIEIKDVSLLKKMENKEVEREIKEDEAGWYWYIELLGGMELNENAKLATGRYVIDRRHMSPIQKDAFFYYKIVEKEGKIWKEKESGG